MLKGTRWLLLKSLNNLDEERDEPGRLLQALQLNRSLAVACSLHPSRFTNRYQGERPFRRVARETSENAGDFRELGVTAIQLLPVNEVSSSNSWGYDPAYFYAAENDDCGAEGLDDLKHLVYTCRQHGLAVVLDVVFNHAGGDNILWEVAGDSFFDGDTQWGALVNFDHPQCQYLFAQNQVYLANEFRIDAFRLDHTTTIVHSAAWDPGAAQFASSARVAAGNSCMDCGRPWNHTSAPTAC